MSYAKALQKKAQENASQTSVETTTSATKRRLLFAGGGACIRTANKQRAAKSRWAMFGTMAGGETPKPQAEADQRNNLGPMFYSRRPQGSIYE